MFMPNIGVGELLVIFITTMFSLALPVGFLFLLYKIYVKLKNIEEHLKKS